LTIDEVESHLKDTSWTELSTEIDFNRTVFDSHWSTYQIPEVLCLINLNPHNFLYDSKAHTISIIDFDHCSQAYFLLDIVSYFLELASENPENKYPTRDVQKEFLKEYDTAIAGVEVIHGSNRLGDIPHSLASIEKAQRLLGYQPTHAIDKGLEEAVKWYWNNLI